MEAATLIGEFFICESSNWRIPVIASNPQEAAEIALQAYINSEKELSFGSAISVTQLIKSGEASIIYTPHVLADIGEYKIATNLAKQIITSHNEKPTN